MRIILLLLVIITTSMTSFAIASTKTKLVCYSDILGSDIKKIGEVPAIVGESEWVTTVLDLPEAQITSDLSVALYKFNESNFTILAKFNGTIINSSFIGSVNRLRLYANTGGPIDLIYICEIR